MKAIVVACVLVSLPMVGCGAAEPSSQASECTRAPELDGYCSLRKRHGWRCTSPAAAAHSSELAGYTDAGEIVCVRAVESNELCCP